jgi:hypothetical protein
VLSHELAHYAVYRWFGFRGATLHFGSASYADSDVFWQQLRAGDIAAATQVVPVWQAGVAYAAGLLATYGTLTACLWVARRRPHPFVVGLGLIAALRFLGSVVVVAKAIFNWGLGNGSDEEHIALALRVPELGLHMLGIAALAITWVVLLRAAPRDIKWGTAAILTGIVVGGALYIGVLGPWLLP